MIFAENFTLLVPTYNPSNGWEKIFYQRYTEFCKHIGHKINVLLINDGSTIEMHKGISFLHDKIGQNFNAVGYESNKGKGYALKFGAKSSNSNFYIFTDIDFPYSVISMQKVFNAMNTGEGIIVGNRENSYYDSLSFSRTLLSKGLKFLNKLVLNLPVTDTQCGLKAFDYKVKELLLTCKTDRFLIDLELLLAANKLNINIMPIDVQLREDIDFTKFNSSVIIKEMFNFISLIWTYRINK